MEDTAGNRRLRRPGRAGNDNEVTREAVPFQGPDEGDDDAASLLESLASAHSASKQDAPSHVSEERDNLGTAERQLEEAQSRSNSNSNPSLRQSSSSRSHSHHSGGSGKGSDAGGVSGGQRLPTTKAIRGAPRTGSGLGSGEESGHGSGSLQGSGSHASGECPQPSSKELIDLRSQLDKSLSKNAEILSEEKDHARDKARMVARHEAQVKNQQQRLDDALAMITEMRLDHGSNTDRLQAELAEHRSKISQLELNRAGNSELEDALKTLKTKLIMQANATATLKAENDIDKAKLIVQNRNAKEEQLDIEAARDRLADSIYAQMKAHKAQVDTLKSELQDAGLMVDWSSEEEATEMPTGTQSMQQRLNNANARASASADELSELRLQLLEIRKDKATAISDLQGLLDEANAKLAPAGLVGVTASSSSGLGVGIGAGRSAYTPKQPKKSHFPAGKLLPIEEDDNQSVDESLSPSVVVSSSEGENAGIANLSDFDDNELVEKKVQSNLKVSRDTDGPKQSLSSLEIQIQTLLAGTKAGHLVTNTIERFQTELAEMKSKHDKANVWSAGRVAQQESTIARLKDRIATISAAKEKNDELQRAALLQKTSDMAAESAELHHSKQLLELAQDNNVNKANLLEDLRCQLGDVQDLQDKLCMALEGKRMAELRVEDLKVRVDNMERDHELAMSRQYQESEAATPSSLSSSYAAAASSGGSRDPEVLLRRIDSLTQERNMLMNQMEGNEVMWRNKMEDMTMQHEAALLEQKRQHAIEIRVLKDETVVLRKELSLVDKSQSLQISRAPQPDSIGVDARSALRESVGATIPSSSSTRTVPWLQRVKTWLDALNCPVRDPKAHASAHSSCSAHHAQGVSWKVLNQAPGIVALRCSINDITILEASEIALRTFGPDARSGQSLLGLVIDKQKALLLKRAILIQQGLAADAEDSQPAGFTVGNIGTVHFKDKSSKMLRSSVTVAHLPFEPMLQKEATLVIIIAPETDQDDKISSGEPEADRDDQRSSRRRRVAPGSGVSEVSSIRPTDSASNVCF